MCKHRETKRGRVKKEMIKYVRRKNLDCEITNLRKKIGPGVFFRCELGLPCLENKKINT